MPGTDRLSPRPSVHHARHAIEPFGSVGFHFTITFAIAHTQLIGLLDDLGVGGDTLHGDMLGVVGAVTFEGCQASTLVGFGAVMRVGCRSATPTRPGSLMNSTPCPL